VTACMKNFSPQFYYTVIIVLISLFIVMVKGYGACNTSLYANQPISPGGGPRQLTALVYYSYEEVKFIKALMLSHTKS
jgi:hypothetical protein